MESERASDGEGPRPQKPKRKKRMEPQVDNGAGGEEDKEKRELVVAGDRMSFWNKPFQRCIVVREHPNGTNVLYSLWEGKKGARETEQNKMK